MTTKDADIADTSSAMDTGVDVTAMMDAGDNRNDILGTFESGMCPLVSGEINSASPSFKEDGLVFVMGEKYERASFSMGGQTLFDIPNAGGSSLESEIMSFEILHYCEGATLLKTETQIQYAPPDDSGPNSITDYLAEINGKKVGVSVTRSYKPSSQMYTTMDAKTLLETKLAGINRSSMRVLAQDKWVKQILHVFASNQQQHDAVVQAYPTIDPSLRADTIVLLTRTTGGGFIYCNPDPPLGMECP